MDVLRYGSNNAYHHNQHDQQQHVAPHAHGPQSSFGVDPKIAELLANSEPQANTGRGTHTPAHARGLPIGETDAMLAQIEYATQRKRISRVQEVVTHAPPEKSRLLETLVMRMRGDTLVTPDTLELLIRELEATNPITEPSASELLFGTWEVIYTSVPHLTRGGYEGWTLTHGALVLRQKNSNIPRSYLEDEEESDGENLIINKVVGEQEDAKNAMYAAVAHVYIQTDKAKIIDMKKGKDSLPSPPVRTTYLDMNMRVMRTEEGGTLVLCKSDQSKFKCL